MVTVKTWKKLASFNPIVEGELDVDGTVKLIAEATGESVEDVENLPISDLLPKFIEVLNAANKAVFERLKNYEGEGIRK